MPYHFSHWSSIQPSPPSPPESMLRVRRASTAESCGGGGEEGARGLESEEKRVGERRSEHTERWERQKERERGEGGGGAAHPGRWKSRCVRFRASLLLLIHTAQGGRFGNYLKRKSRISYRWVVLYNLLLSSALVPPFRCLCSPREPQQENTTHAMA